MATHEEVMQNLNEFDVDFLILAERAEALNGKLYMMGGAWDKQFVQSFQQPVFLSFALGILVPWNRTNEEHTLQISIESADGTLIGSVLDAQFSAGRPPTLMRGERQRVILAAGLAQLFPGPGRYTLIAGIDGEAMRQTDFHLLPVTALPNMQ